MRRSARSLPRRMLRGRRACGATASGSRPAEQISLPGGRGDEATGHARARGPALTRPLDATGGGNAQTTSMDVSGRLVVAIHDVAPPWAEEVRYLLDVLDRIGVTRRVLKVIPDQDGSHDIRDDPAFMRLLAEEAAAGSEIVLHGYTHRVAGPLRGSRQARLRARLFAGDAAEFLTLDDAQMVERLTAGRRILYSGGLDPRGFCAPCWLAPAQLPRLLRRCGFRYCINMATIVDVTTGDRLWTPWIGYMGAGAGQERLVSMGGQVFASIAPAVPIVKVFFHPQGARDSAACARIVRVLARLACTRRLETYGSLVAG